MGKQEAVTLKSMGRRHIAKNFTLMLMPFFG